MNTGIYMNVISFLLILISSTSSLPQAESKTTIVFVCEHGGARSTIASLYFNKLAKENHLSYRSVFRGLMPDSTITKEAREGLIGDGFELASLAPVALTTKDVAPSTLFISLDCKIPTSYHTFRTWTGIPAISTDYQIARNEIVKQLNQLILELKKREAVK